MNDIAQSRIESTVNTSYALPAMLAINTLGLFALEQLGGIPAWVKTATALFLSF